MASPPAGIVRAIRRSGHLFLLTLLHVTATIGWLYWVRATVAALPGPKLGDALPLDALATHDSVPVVIYLVAFALAGVLLGLAMHHLRLEGRGRAAVLVAYVWFVLYVFDVISLFTVRQIPFLNAIGQAFSVGSAYVAAVVAGIAAYLITRTYVHRTAN
jgi:hypothetical protein